MTHHPLQEEAARLAEAAADVLKLHLARPSTPLEVFAAMARVHRMVELVVLADSAMVVIKQAFDALGEAIARSSPYNPENPTTTIQVPGLPALTPRWPKDRKEWANDRLRDDVVVAARKALDAPARVIDPETGEEAPGFDEAVAAIESVVSIIGGNIKTRGMKALGLDADEYARTVKGTPGVQVVRPS